MCGIFGLFSNKKIDSNCAINMSKILAHRGPDDEGFVFFNDDESIVQLKGFDTPMEVSSELNLKQHITDFKNLSSTTNFLGHRRLSILDLSSSGHQPMRYLEKYWIVFNGEIYNYIEIREELKNFGYQFNSNSDTEVILAAYDKWGCDCLNKFNGMWSFIIYDTRNKSIFISRDRFGVKPFYFHHSEGLFLFGSEPKALLESGLITTSPNLTYIKKYLISGPNESSRQTAFQDINRVEASHYIFCSLSDLLLGKFEQIKYWKLNPNCSNERFNSDVAKQLAKKYFDLLEDAVRLRLRADVKVGSALSGGLDSSSIVYLVNKIQKETNETSKQETFSCVYNKEDEKFCDETIFIDKIANILNVKSNKIEPKSKNVPIEHSHVTWAMDTPCANSSMSGWHTYKLIKEAKIKVTLEGQGADEQLAGYLGYIYIYMGNLNFLDLIKEAYSFLKMPNTFKHVCAGIIINLLIKIGFYSLANKIFIKITNSDVPLDTCLNKRLVNDSMNGLVNLLHYGDRVSMAHSVESRMPFLDYRLAEFFASIPANYKMHNGWTKYIARLAFDGLLPDEICWRRDKMGWPVPEKLWLSGPLREWFWKTIENSKLVKLFVKGKIQSNKIPNSFYYINLASWEKMFKIRI